MSNAQKTQKQKTPTHESPAAHALAGLLEKWRGERRAKTWLISFIRFFAQATNTPELSDRVTPQLVRQHFPVVIERMARAPHVRSDFNRLSRKMKSAL
jgi:hypothetical protein